MNTDPATGYLGQESQRVFTREMLFRVCVTLAFGGAIFLSGCSDTRASYSSRPKETAPAVPVNVATVSQKTVPIEVHSIGNVEAYSTISVKSQIGGELTHVYFKEGENVKKGALLFNIDTRPFEEAVKQAQANVTKDAAQAKLTEANVARDSAQAKYAEVEAHRYEHLVEQQLISKEQYDQVRANAEALEATVRADKAAVDDAEAALRSDRAGLKAAKLQLEYCFIRAPIDGRTGSLMVHQGNLVKANDVPLVVIDQINPIHVTFSVPEQELPEIRKYMAQATLKVEVTIPNDEKQAPIAGTLAFVDNAVDNTTGTIRLKGKFANVERRLWPGQFVDVVLTLTMQPNAVVIPSQAIQSGQKGPYVFVVKPDLTVESRPIAVSRTRDSETVVEKGLRQGEMVVTDGQLRLVPGARVKLLNENQSG